MCLVELSPVIQMRELLIHVLCYHPVSILCKSISGRFRVAFENCFFFAPRFFPFRVNLFFVVVFFFFFFFFFLFCFVFFFCFVFCLFVFCCFFVVVVFLCCCCFVSFLFFFFFFFFFFFSFA